MIILSSALQDFANIIQFFQTLGDLFNQIFAFLPPFIRPLAIAYITLSLIYFIVGRS